MAEFTAAGLQTVSIGQNVLFTETPISGGTCVVHREGSGIATLRGITNQCTARYKVSFGANVAVAAGGTLGPVSLAIAIDGEPLQSATMIVTPAAIGDFFNVHAEVFICAPRGCCVTAAVENTSATAIDVQNANLIIERKS